MEHDNKEAAITSKPLKKKMKREKQLKEEVPIPEPTQCHYYVKQKHRFCNKQQAPNSNYCHTHLHLQDTANNNNNEITKESSSEQQNQTTENDKQKRVPCPIDPSHTVYEHRLKKHIKICNKSKSQQQMKQQAYYMKNINYNFLNEKSTILDNNEYLDLNLNELWNNQKEYFTNLILKIKNLYENLKLNEFIETNIKESFNFSLSFNNEDFQEKHHRQHCSFLCNLKETNCLSKDYDYIEFGSGKATLSYFVRRALLDKEQLEIIEKVKNNNEITNKQEEEIINEIKEIKEEEQSKQQFILIDRENQRRKVDNYIRYGKIMHHKKYNDELKVPLVKVNRLMIDIGDLKLSKVNDINNEGRKSISISKHLCGIATDLTLACLKEYNEDFNNEKNKGIFIALCCHHKCNWKGYINRSFFEENGFNAFDFRVMTLLTSFATCDFEKLSKLKEEEGLNNNKKEEEKKEEYIGLTNDEKESIGFMCKRLIDYGRILFLQSLNQYKKVKLMYYCNRDITPENCMLIALQENN
ncbi:hypothetical protein ABK040_003423 [Willaertia magna]